MKSLRARLIAGTALVLGVVIGGFSIALYAATARAQETSARMRMTALADRLAGAVEWRESHAGERKGDGESRKKRESTGRYRVETDLLPEGGEAAGTAFCISDAEGHPLAQKAPPGWPEGFGAAGAAPSAGAPPAEVRFGDRLWRTLHVARSPFVEDDHSTRPPPFRIALAVDVTEERNALRRLATVLLVLGPAVFLLGVAGAGAVIHRGLAPLREIASAADGVDERTLSARVDVPPTGDELARVAEALNGALTRLEAGFARERSFIADASHELRTPVTILLTSIEVALQRKREPGEYEEALRTLLDTSRRMRGIVESLLTLAMADAGRITLNRETVDLSDLLRRAVEAMRVVAAPKEVTIGLRAERPAVVSGDAAFLRQLFDNLLSNAIRYNRPGGRVEVVVEGGADGATVSVRDTGIGIPAEHLPFLFERFYRVDRGRSRKEGGSGLGLSIARWIAEAHGGGITVESVPEQGTEFRVKLPVGKTKGVES